MDQTQRAVILKIGQFRESDLWVRLLTPQHGILTTFAFGGRKSRRRFCGCLDPLNEILAHIKSNRAGSYLTLTEGSLLHAPRRLREDQPRLGMAVNCLKFVDALPIGGEASPAAFSLLQETLLALEAEPRAPACFPVFFRGRLAFDLGFVPCLDSCCVCGRRHGPWWFQVEEGRLFCPDCRKAGPGLDLHLGTEALRTLEFIRSAAPGEWTRSEFCGQGLREGLRAVDSFVRFHVGLAWDRGSFRVI